MFKNKSITEYPKSFLYKWKYQAKHLTEIFGNRLWVTIPDYPDDLAHQFGHENVEKTLRNVEEFIAVDKVNWLVPIQSQYLNTFSFIESCHRTKELIGNYPRIAIGTVCKTNKIKFIKFCCEVVRKTFPNSWIHGFGMTLKALPKVYKYINTLRSLTQGMGHYEMEFDRYEEMPAQLAAQIIADSNE